MILELEELNEKNEKIYLCSQQDFGIEQKHSNLIVKGIWTLNIFKFTDSGTLIRNTGHET